jgi:plastocyanin
MKTKIKTSDGLFILFVVMLLVVSISYGCSKSNSSTTTGGDAVSIQSFAFSPATITVTVNATVTWTNNDAVGHTVTSDNGVFDSGTINPNATYSHQFTTVGTFNYHCTIHPTMLAKVVVQAASGY